MKTKMALFVPGSLKYLTCAEDEKNGSSSSKEGVSLLPKIGAVELITQVDSKQKLQLSWSKWHMMIYCVWSDDRAP